VRRFLLVLAPLAPLVIITAAGAQEPNPFASAFDGVQTPDTREATSGAESEWGIDPSLTSAALAREWRYMGMSALSWPDGRQAVVTMWQSTLGELARCFDYYDAAMVPVGGKCERAGTSL